MASGPTARGLLEAVGSAPARTVVPQRPARGTRTWLKCPLPPITGAVGCPTSGTRTHAPPRDPR